VRKHLRSPAALSRRPWTPGAAQDAARAAGFRVLSAIGVEPEAQLPFAGLHHANHDISPSPATKEANDHE